MAVGDSSQLNVGLRVEMVPSGAIALGEGGATAIFRMNALWPSVGAVGLEAPGKSVDKDIAVDIAYTFLDPRIRY